MNNTLRSGLAAVAGALAVAFLVPTTPARTQDRGTSVIVANTPADPVPARVVNTDPISTTLTNDPGSPLFVAPVDRAIFNICPRSCGAYQATTEPAHFTFDGLAAELSAPVGTRLTIRHLSMEVRVPFATQVSVYVLSQFGDDTGRRDYPVPLEGQAGLGGVFGGQGLKYLVASLPVHLYHDTTLPEVRLTAKAFVRSGTWGSSPFLKMSVSGNLEPLLQP